MHRLFTEIDKFQQWALEYSEIPQDERGGEWECEYEHWQDIYDHFSDFIEHFPAKNWNKSIKDKLLYIIARDNEMEILSDMLHGKELIELAGHSLQDGCRDSKYQLAVKLSKLKDKNKVLQLLEAYVNDHDEYVNRRALLELARLNPQKAELYCEKFWKRNIYEDDLYQKQAVLWSLKEIESPLFEKYLAEAKADGNMELAQYAYLIEKG